LYNPDGVVSGQLEAEGPFGHTFPSTANRAVLRAVIAAVVLRDWKAEGVDTIVIATDSGYVVDGATSWSTPRWIFGGSSLGRWKS
jgi:ribonuclease HI